MKDFGLNRIFVEGNADKLFIEALLFKYFGIDCEQPGNKGIVINVAGKDKLKNQPDLSNAERVAVKAKNLIIFDTDFEANGGGTDKRRAEYEQIAAALDTKFEVYLLPNNDKEGTLEDLVKSCMMSEFAFFDDCWQNMIACFKRRELPNLNLPQLKAYNFAYGDLLKFYRKNLEGNEYLDEQLWNLSIETNEDLKQLVDFIEQNFFEH